MNHCHAGLILPVLQIVIEGTQLMNQHHAFVNDGAAGQRAYIGFCLLMFKLTAQNVKFSVKGKTAGHIAGLCNEALPNRGHGASCACAQNFRMAGYITPADQLHSFRSGQPRKDFAGHLGSDGIFGQKEHTHAIFTGRTQRKMLSGRPFGE